MDNTLQESSHIGDWSLWFGILFIVSILSFLVGTIIPFALPDSWIALPVLGVFCTSNGTEVEQEQEQEQRLKVNDERITLLAARLMQGGLNVESRGNREAVDDRKGQVGTRKILSSAQSSPCQAADGKRSAGADVSSSRFGKPRSMASQWIQGDPPTTW
ncbi:hypothetical protein B0T13DRAFT_448423 [Neurospora crassa]|nr:hypothetical protein B0T13DRAFT_448423 [Neurospora crassa]